LDELIAQELRHQPLQIFERGGTAFMSTDRSD